MSVRTSAPTDEPSGPGADRLPHFPALDGLRGVALFFVLLFHSGFDFVRAGYLPLSSFFVLSGFLITSLLLLEHHRTGRIDLRAFWRRRARRLVPAMLLGLGLVAAYVAFGARTAVPDVVGDVGATLVWVTNWRFIVNGVQYEDLFSDPSPLQHFWSLAVEEQFYLVLPLVTVPVLAWKGRRLLAAVAGVGIVASTMLMQALYVPGETPFRAYLGTDTRAAELLIGVLLATVMVGPDGFRTVSGRSRRAVNAAGAVGLAVLFTSWIVVPEYADWIFRGGLQALAVVAAVVIVAATDRNSMVARVLELRPLVLLGTISYGVYLFHWPLFLWLGEDETGLRGWPLFALRFGLAVGLATASYLLVERPIRFGEFPALPALVSWANASVAVLAVTAIVSVGVSDPFADIAFDSVETTGAGASTPSPPPSPLTDDVLPTHRSGTTTTSTTSTAPPAGTTPAAGPSPTTPPTTAPPTTAAVTTTTAPPPVRVQFFGDSLGDNLAYGLREWSSADGSMVIDNRTQLGCVVSRGGQRQNSDGQPWAIPSRCHDFAVHWPADIAAFQPDVVVIVTGHGEMWERKIPGWNEFLAPGDPTFDAWLSSEYQAAVDVASRTGARVVWVPPPCVQYRQGSYEGFLDVTTGNERIRYLDQVLVPDLARRRPIVVGDLHGVACPNGAYSDTVLGRSGARPDGVHFSGPATIDLARQFLGPVVRQAAGR